MFVPKYACGHNRVAHSPPNHRSGGGADRWRLHYSETTHVQSPALLLNTKSKKEAAEPASLTSCCPLIKPTITSWSQTVGPLQPRQAQLSIKAFQGWAQSPAAVCPHRRQPAGGPGHVYSLCLWNAGGGAAACLLPVGVDSSLEEDDGLMVAGIMTPVSVSTALILCFYCAEKCYGSTMTCLLSQMHKQATGNDARGKQSSYVPSL